MTNHITSSSQSASEQTHPYYLAAVLSSASAAQQNASVKSEGDWKIPPINFSTEDWTRRSMALNGMRMSTEFFARESPRVLTLVEQRLEAGQSDVVHDILVYLWERVLQLRHEALEARTLQAQSLAAYLGLPEAPVIELFLQPEFTAEGITDQIESGAVGTPQRSLKIPSLVENLLARLRPELEELHGHENRVFYLINEIVARLYQNQFGVSF